MMRECKIEIRVEVKQWAQKNSEACDKMCTHKPVKWIMLEFNIKKKGAMKRKMKIERRRTYANIVHV